MTILADEELPVAHGTKPFSRWVQSHTSITINLHYFPSSSCSWLEDIHIVGNTSVQSVRTVYVQLAPHEDLLVLQSSSA